MNDTSYTEMNHVIYHQTSPDGQIQALVEQDDRVAYFYLASDLKSFETKACWVRNLVAGPITIDQREMEQGIAPTLPRTVCQNQDGQSPLDSEHLSVVWFEEGNGAVLFEKQDVLAVIPPGSGVDGFHGFARDCKTQNSICWPMPDLQELDERIENAKVWWQEWTTGNPWKTRQTALLERLEAGLGTHEKYFSIDGQKWPPKGLAFFQQSFWQALVTVGVSLRPQPNVELASDSPNQFSRFELGLLGAPVGSERLIQALGGWLSGMSNYPWHHQTWVAHGHTSSLPPDITNGTFPFVLLAEHGELLRRVSDRAGSEDPLNLLAPFERLALPPYRQCLTNLLWAIPITSSEQQQAAAGGTDALLDHFIENPKRLLLSPSDNAAK